MYLLVQLEYDDDLYVSHLNKDSMKEPSLLEE